MALPTLTADQRAEALKHASEARRHRSEWLRGIKDRSEPFADLVAEAKADPILNRTRVALFLTSFPRVGSVRRDELMRRAAVAPNRRIGGLGDKQISELSQLIDSRRITDAA